MRLDMIRRANGLAWAVAALSLAFVFGGLGIGWLDRDAPAAQTGQNGPIGILLILVIVAFVVAGALIGARRPKNAIGWIFAALGLVFNLGLFANAYGMHALFVHPGSLPGGKYMMLLSDWSQGPVMLGGFVAVFLLFPNGQLLSPRWRVVLLADILATVMINALVLKPGPLQNYPAIENPLGGNAGAPVWAAIGNLGFMLLLVCLAAAAVSLILRFRRAKGEERQQLKWIAASGGFVASAFVIAPVIWFTPALGNTPLWPVLFFLSVLSIPVSVGIAVLKYRLYDVDLIIRRTVTYTLLTALLALIYLGSVALLQELLRGMIGQTSDVAIVLSTLAMVVLFTPLRRRIQDGIDRRFYRRKYDAARVLSSFGATVRDEVDLSRLTDELLGVVEETMQPQITSLWIRQVEPTRSRVAGEEAGQ